MVSSVSNSPSTPVIGLTTYIETARHGAWEEMAALLPVTYLNAVARSGGCAVMLPPMPVDPTTALSVVDGLVVTGGPDVSRGAIVPSHTHGRTTPTTSAMRGNWPFAWEPSQPICPFWRCAGACKCSTFPSGAPCTNIFQISLVTTSTALTSGK